MCKKISKSDEIFAKLKSEDKVINLDTLEYLVKMREMNKYMENVRRDFIFKSVMSERSASEVILNS